MTPAVRSRYLTHALNAGWLTVEYLWYPLLGIVTAPILLKSMGEQQYGLWMLFTATVSFGAVLNIGTGAAIIKAVSALSVEERGRRFPEVVSGALGIALLGGGVLASVVVAFFWLGADGYLLKLGDPLSVMLTGAGAAGIAWLEQIDNVFASAIKGSERFQIAAKTEMAGKFLQLIAVLACGLGGAGLYALYISFYAATFARLLLKARVTNEVSPMRLLKPRFSGHGELLHYSKWGWLQGVGSITFSVADRFIVGGALGVEKLASYSLALQLAIQVHALVAAMFSAVFPAISRQQSSFGRFRITRLAAMLFALNLIISTVLALPLYLFPHEILSLWVGRTQAAASWECLRLLAVAYWILSLNVTPHFVLLGLGRMRFVALSNVAGGAVAMAACFELIRMDGINGAALAKIGFGLAVSANFLPVLKTIWKEKREAIG